MRFFRNLSITRFAGVLKNRRHRYLTSIVRFSENMLSLSCRCLMKLLWAIFSLPILFAFKGILGVLFHFKRPLYGNSWRRSCFGGLCDILRVLQVYSQDWSNPFGGLCV
ncbi:hypothetical protein CDAR_527281 [Caerostris darwini]|uniref:Uncharacterized protein n=1 Tax=Caerostris darwini TaxID=1538125 RepID=A0AAV4WME2_9ARAC|nr:hypothetical protein CDAR_527281 [Caerostris darwini]